MPREKRSSYALEFNFRFGRRIAERRGALDWSHAELAERSGLSARVIRRIEQGKRDPDVGALVALADAFGLRAADLFHDMPTPPPGARSDWPEAERIAETEEMVKAFHRISDEDQRRQIIALLKACVESGQY